jgi:ACS family glucarate transporter-like MFS transporter
MQEVYQEPQILSVGRMGRRRWLVMYCTFIVAAVSYLDRSNISIAASSMQREFRISDVQLGALFSAFALGYALTQPFAGRMADRIGAWRAIAIGLIWWSVCTALLPIVPIGIRGALGVLMAVRFLLGIGEAVIFPASNRLVASWIPTSERGLANGVIFAGVGVGAGIAPPLITFVMISYGWRWAFWLCALIGLAVSGLWMLLVRNSPAEYKHIGAAELAYINAGIPASSLEVRRSVKWRELLLDRQIRILTLSYACYGYVAYMFFTWFFKYLSDVRGLNLKSSALYATLPFIAMAIASSLGGLVSDRLLGLIGKRAARCGVASASLFVAGVFVWSATSVADLRLAAVVLAGGAGALYFAQSAYWAISADIGGPSAGVVSGIMNMGQSLGAVLTATLTPVVAEAFGWTASFIVAAGVCFLGALAWMLIDPFHALTPRTP